MGGGGGDFVGLIIYIYTTFRKKSNILACLILHFGIICKHFRLTVYTKVNMVLNIPRNRKAY